MQSSAGAVEPPETLQLQPLSQPWMLSQLNLNASAFRTILHLDQLKHLNAPVASIGGAGTFDGIFLTGILAVLLS